MTGGHTTTIGTTAAYVAPTVDLETFTQIEGGLSTDVVNEAGTTLPETGGMGTTIFYVLGGLLVVGAGVLLIVRLRMRATNNE